MIKTPVKFKQNFRILIETRILIHLGLDRTELWHTPGSLCKTGKVKLSNTKFGKNLEFEQIFTLSILQHLILVLFYLDSCWLWSELESNHVHISFLLQGILGEYLWISPCWVSPYWVYPNQVQAKTRLLTTDRNRSRTIPNSTIVGAIGIGRQTLSNFVFAFNMAKTAAGSGDAVVAISETHLLLWASFQF